LKISKKILGISLLPILLLLLSAVFSGMSIQDNNNATKKYIHDYVERQNEISKIYKLIGYNGAIHFFKNYIIREDERYKESFNNSVKEAKYLIYKYQKLEHLSKEETIAMNILDSTLTLYKQNIIIAEEMMKQGIDKELVDQKVKVDDSPAMVALENLQRYFIEKRDEELLKVDESQRQSLTTVIIIFIFALILSIVLSQNISRKIIYSIKRLIDLALRFSKEEYKTDKDYTIHFSDDELKVLAEQFIELGYNLDNTFNKLKIANDNLSQFAFVASHDLQEPIKKIYSFSELLELESKDHLNITSKNYLREIQQSSERMVSLIKALLNFSNIQESSFEKEKVDLHTLISLAILNLDLKIKETNTTFDISSLKIVYGNTDLLISLFQNIFSNSLKFINPEKQNHIIIQGRELNESFYQISIKDNGIGFDEKNINEILKPFGRLNSRHVYPGLGIGLALCKRIVEAHNGNLTIKSTEGVGSEVLIDLPLSNI